jgi:mono/diheme cytochrome c family protein
MRLRYSICLVAMVVACALISLAQETKPAVKHEAAAATSPSSGKEMFISYCAPCHGKSGKGDGPAAAALKQPPADLTMLAKGHGGKYPSDLVTSVLSGKANLTAHGDQEMPVWGRVFGKMSQGHEELVQLRIANLNRYLESLQEK